jgi:hypothetical protein
MYIGEDTWYTQLSPLILALFSPLSCRLTLESHFFIRRQ